MVGAVLVKREIVVGEGYHARAGEPHAEIHALHAAGEKARGATLYINLEPCSHYGRTPPCAPALVRAGVKRVVIGMEDPNPLVKGRGLKILRKAGLDVKTGVLGEACERLNEIFCKYIQTRMPFVILKIAASLDGKIATSRGESKWITGEPSRRLVHQLRKQVDGLLVGVGTVLKDDPMLTARLTGGRDPYRIILDSRLRTPERAQVILHKPEKTILATTDLASKKRKGYFEKAGVSVLTLNSIQGKVDLRSLLIRLGQLGFTSLLVEGGAEVNGSFLRSGLIDKILLFLAPKLIGGDEAYGIFGQGRGPTLKDALLLHSLKVRKIGEDLLIEGYPKSTCLQAS